jgi:hypothetical protein
MLYSFYLIAFVTQPSIITQVNWISAQNMIANYVPYLQVQGLGLRAPRLGLRPLGFDPTSRRAKLAQIKYI